MIFLIIAIWLVCGFVGYGTGLFTICGDEKITIFDRIFCIFISICGPIGLTAFLFVSCVYDGKTGFRL